MHLQPLPQHPQGIMFFGSGEQLQTRIDLVGVAAPHFHLFFISFKVHDLTIG